MTLSSVRKQWGQWLALGLILAAAAALRIHRLGQASTWYDERASIMSSTGHLDDWVNMPVGQVIDPPDLSSLKNESSFSAAWHTPDFHPPLYTITLRMWRSLFGESDVAVRSLSVVASMAALLCLFDLACTLSGFTAALWATAVMAVAYPQISYAQEARDYALWWALAMAASAAAARLAVYGPAWRRAIGLNLCLMALLMTHFLAAGSVAAVVIWCAVWLRGRALRQALIVAACCLPIVFVLGGGMIRQGIETRHDSDWLTEAPAGHVWRDVRRVVQIPAQFLAEPREGTESADAAAVAAFFLTLVLARRNPAILWCGLWLWCGVGLVFVLDMLRDTTALIHDRFTLVAAPGLYLLLAILPLRRGFRHVLPGLAVIGCLLALGLELPADRNTTYKGQWRELGGDLRRLVRRGDLVVFASGARRYLGEPRKMYEGTAYYSGRIPCPILLLDSSPDAAALGSLKQASHVWVVTPPPPVNAADFLPGWQVEPAAPRRRYSGLVWRATLQ